MGKNILFLICLCVCNTKQFRCCCKLGRGVNSERNQRRETLEERAQWILFTTRLVSFSLLLWFKKIHTKYNSYSARVEYARFRTNFALTPNREVYTRPYSSQNENCSLFFFLPPRVSLYSFGLLLLSSLSHKDL